MKALNDELQMRSRLGDADLLRAASGVKADGVKAHPTQKPEALLYRVLLACTKPGDVVLDPFFGTGTTGAVARRLGRHWIGIEREKRYVEVARERIDSTLRARRERDADDAGQARQPRVPFGALVETGLVPPGATLTDAKRRWTRDVSAPTGRSPAKASGSIHKIGATLQGAPSLQRLDLLARRAGWRAALRSMPCGNSISPRYSAERMRTLLRPTGLRRFALWP